MTPIVLFNKYDFYDVVRDKSARLKAEYERLSDEDALNGAVSQGLKEPYRMDVPSLKKTDMYCEEIEVKRPPDRAPRLFKDLLIHIPFDGEAGVFNIKPNATGGAVVMGSIVGSELLLTITPPNKEYDVAAHM